MQATVRNLVASLKPGQSVKLGESHGVSTWAERSGDGKTIRHVRESARGFVVFKTERSA